MDGMCELFGKFPIEKKIIPLPKCAKNSKNRSLLYLAWTPKQRPTKVVMNPQKSGHRRHSRQLSPTNRDRWK